MLKIECIMGNRMKLLWLCVGGVIPCKYDDVFVSGLDMIVAKKDGKKYLFTKERGADSNRLKTLFNH